MPIDGDREILVRYSYLLHCIVNLIIILANHIHRSPYGKFMVVSSMEVHLLHLIGVSHRNLVTLFMITKCVID